MSRKVKCYVCNKVHKDDDSYYVGKRPHCCMEHARITHEPIGKAIDELLHDARKSIIGRKD